jgi:hypothetical protein
VLGVNHRIIVLINRGFVCKLVKPTKIKNTLYLLKFEKGNKYINIVVLSDVIYEINISHTEQ